MSRLPSPLDPKAWPDPVRAIAWAALGSIALVAIGAGIGALSSLLAAQGGVIYALLAGWLFGLLASGPIAALSARGWSRGRAALLVWLAGAIPGAKLITYPGVGHVPMEQIPDLSARDLRVFLESLPPG